MTKSRGILPPRRSWTPEDVSILKNMYPDSTGAEVAHALSCTPSRVYQMANRLGLEKSAAFLASVKSGRVARGRQHPRMIASQFKKGQAAWNKGTRFVAGGRSAETRFKPGAVPRNHRPVGSLRINTDGGLDIKLAEGLRCWKQLSHYVWFLHTGSWPPARHVLRARNGDAHDTRFENLELLTCAENLRRNYHDRYPLEFRRLVQLKGQISRQVNRLTREASQ